MDWRQAAQALADELGFAWLPRSVESELRAGAGPLFVACSGGADSVFATLAMFAYPPCNDSSRALTCLHFDHALRASSEGDAAFVASLCEGLGIAFRSGKASWEGDVSRVSEDEARRARLAFFEREIASAGLERAQIVTGHQRDDIAESMLMRLSRGSGLQGLAAPREVSRAGRGLVFLRPLLGLGREEIRAALRRVGADWREDDSNASGRFYRNRLRSAVMPAWEAASDRPVGPGVARARSLLEEDWRALEEVAENSWREAARGEDALDLAALARMPRAIRRRALARLCGGEAAGAVCDRALDALEAGEDFDFAVGERTRLVGGDGLARRVEWVERLVGDWGPAAAPEGCWVWLPDGARARVDRVPVDAALWRRLRAGRNDDASEAHVSIREKQSEVLSVRRRRGGDAFKPHGKSSAKKLNDLLIERKIGAEVRDVLPIFVDASGEVVWMPGIPPSAERLLGPDSTLALRLTYHR